MPEESPLAKWLTLPGRVLLVVTILGSACVFYFYFMDSYRTLPAGSYPILLWLVPVAIAAAFFFFGTAFLLERAGVKIYRPR